MLTFKITNRAAFGRSVKALEDKIRARVAEAVSEAGEKIAAGARERAPVKTGRLKESIRVESSQRDLTAEVSAGAPYARFVEFGTLRRPARPFLVPAAEENRPEAARLVRAALNRAIGS